MGVIERLGLDDIVEGILSSDDDGVGGNWGGVSSMAERLMWVWREIGICTYMTRARERETEREMGKRMNLESLRDLFVYSGGRVSRLLIFPGKKQERE